MVRRLGFQLASLRMQICKVSSLPQNFVCAISTLNFDFNFFRRSTFQQLTPSVFQADILIDDNRIVIQFKRFCLKAFKRLFVPRHLNSVKRLFDSRHLISVKRLFYPRHLISVKRLFDPRHLSFHLQVKEIRIVIQFETF